EEIEEYLYKLDFISECVVIGRTQEKNDVILTAVIYPDYDKLQGMVDSEILAFIKSQVLDINKHLPSFKQIRNIEIRKTEFEKTTTKKIIRYKVK
ncbi:MAG TPA: hypothetical protein PLT66_07395, partial [Bacillota bacterium]|nr:hypothetical protein [Bacillota bacterium]